MQPPFSVRSPGLEMWATNSIKKNVTSRVRTIKKAFEFQLTWIQSQKYLLVKNGGPHCIPVTAKWGEGRLCVHTVHSHMTWNRQFPCPSRMPCLFSSVNMLHSCLNVINTHCHPKQNHTLLITQAEPQLNQNNNQEIRMLFTYRKWQKRRKQSPLVVSG